MNCSEGFAENVSIFDPIETNCSTRGIGLLDSDAGRKHNWKKQTDGYVEWLEVATPPASTMNEKDFSPSCAVKTVSKTEDNATKGTKETNNIISPRFKNMLNINASHSRSRSRSVKRLAGNFLFSIFEQTTSHKMKARVPNRTCTLFNGAGEKEISDALSIVDDNVIDRLISSIMELDVDEIDQRIGCTQAKRGRQIICGKLRPSTPLKRRNIDTYGAPSSEASHGHRRRGKRKVSSPVKVRTRATCCPRVPSPSRANSNNNQCSHNKRKPSSPVLMKNVVCTTSPNLASSTRAKEDRNQHNQSRHVRKSCYTHQK